MKKSVLVVLFLLVSYCFAQDKNCIWDETKDKIKLRDGKVYEIDNGFITRDGKRYSVEEILAAGKGTKEGKKIKCFSSLSQCKQYSLKTLKKMLYSDEYLSTEDENGNTVLVTATMVYLNNPGKYKNVDEVVAFFRKEMLNMLGSDAMLTVMCSNSRQKLEAGKNADVSSDD